MNEALVRTLEQVRQVLAGTQALEFRRAEDDKHRYAWIEQVLGRLSYRQLGRHDRGAVLAYLQRLSGYSRAQVTRLVSRWMAGAGKPLVKNYCRPAHAFARRYTAADVALLGEVDRAMGTLSGPATACVLRCQRDVFKVPGFDRLADISVAHLYNLRNSAGYRQQRVVQTKTQASRRVDISVRRAPAPEGRAGFIRIDSVHQGDFDGIKGLYHINAVDCVTQWQVVASVQTLSEAHLLPVIEQMLEQFPFVILGFHADNGSEYLNPFLNFHRPCLFCSDIADAKKPGRIKRVYRAEDAMTPLDKLANLPEANRTLREDITLEHLRALAVALTDLQAGEELNEARLALFRRVPARTG